MTALADEALIGAARRGEREAIAALLHVSRPALQRYAQKSCMVSDIEDAVQEALLVLSRRVQQLREARALSTWLFRIVRRECHRLARRSMRVDLWDDAKTDAHLASVSDEELRVSIATALESLPAHYRQVIVLRDLEELTIGEIAEELGIAAPAVKSRLHRARVLTREYVLA